RRCRLTWARLLLARDQPERALEVSARLIDSAPNSNGPRSLPWLALTRGQALAALGHQIEAEADLRAARLGARDLGYRHLLWRTDLALVQLWRDSRRVSEVGWALDEAEAVIEEIAATLPSEVQRVAFLTAARTTLPVVAMSPAMVPAPGGLSPRELEVLRLIAAGLTDAEAGARLSISRRTVGRHLESIYTKLGVGSRTAAAAFAYEHGVMEPPSHGERPR
ncbi:MAG TPA: LuxR C-terminal-related transcriptional regulator, partial [Thermomicrobiaceae bacterium]|nr:LuxR C-terminal-related transcriptional regulator [Thermomicrobiaceae bacterium]